MAALALALVACTGSIGDGTSLGTEPGDEVGTSATSRPASGDPAAPSGASPAGPARGASPSSPATTPPPTAAADDACKNASTDPGPSPLNRLSDTQYLNTLRDLFGDVPGLDAAVGSSSTPSEFGLVQPDVAPVELETYQRAAETVAAFVASTPAKLQAIAPCASGSDKRACARTFVQTFGARAYRAPLTEAGDIDKHLALYDVGAKTSHEHGIELVVRGMLQAPRFLYRVELGTAGSGKDAVRLSGPEVAARLSYVLWDTLPDAALSQAARDGRLDTTQGVSDTVRDMLADPRGSHALRGFLSRWMHVDRLDALVKDDRFYPEWTETPTLRDSMAEQATRTLDDVLERQSGSLRVLLTSSSVFVNKDLASYYGATGDETFKRVERTDMRNAGILTLPALLSVLAKPGESSPIYRGKFVREALLCQMLPAPPPNIPKPPDVQPGVSTRERLSQHEVDPACSGCHQLMDPIGFGLENFDAIGRYRSDDAGAAIDGRGELRSTRDVNGSFHGALELGERLAGSAEVQECMARQWFRFALGRFERDVDDCAVQKLATEFTKAGADLRVLPQLLLTSDAFLTRRPLDDQETP